MTKDIQLSNPLGIAIHARLPLICVTTTDVIYLGDTLAFWAGGKSKIKKIDDVGTLNKNPATLTYIMSSDFIDTSDEEAITEVYTLLRENDRTLIVVNEEDPHRLLFDAGTLLVHPTLMRTHLEENLLPHLDSVDHLLGSLTNLTLLEAEEVLRLAMARYGDTTPQSIMGIRRMLSSRVVGLEQVNTDMDFYIPDDSIVKWLTENGAAFLHAKDHRLIPRGLMFDGPTGVGKTQASKYIANFFNLPLYLLDVPGVLNRYVGVSEAHFRAAINQIDQEAPCIVLLDEVEKLFTLGGDHMDVKSNILNKLLWWMQERRSRALIIMTTNDVESIPPELYRSSRIDRVIRFQGLVYDSAYKFMEADLKTFFDDKDIKAKAKDIKSRMISGLNKAIGSMKEGVPMISQSDANQIVIDSINAVMSVGK